MPKVSVIVPIYNVEKYLAKCIDSIIAQEYDDWELLLINDGSSDSSKAICEKYCMTDNRISLYNQENAGPSAARNLGIKKAIGKSITFIDSDDYVTPSYLSDLVKYDADIVASGFDLWYSNGREQERKTYDQFGEFSETNNNIVEALAIGESKYLWHSPCCKLYRRELLVNNNILFNEGLNYGEDHLFNLNAIQHCKTITLVPVSNYVYTHYGNYTLTNRCVPYETMFKYIIDLYHIRQNIAQYNNEYSKFCSMLIANYYWQTIYTLYNTERCKQKRIEVIKNVNIQIPKHIRFCSSLPRRYKFMRIIYRLLPFFLSDIINRAIAKI